MESLKAPDLEVISGSGRERGFAWCFPCGHRGFMGKIALREDLEPLFVQF